jgi:hypothetical protein
MPILRTSEGPVPSGTRLKSEDRLRNSRTEEARKVAGSIAAATALYRLDQMGMGTLLKNAFLGGAGYQSAPQIAETLQRLAVDDPQVKKALIDGSYGGFDPNTASGKQRLELLSDKLRTDRMRQLGRQTPTDGSGYNAP